MNKEIFEVRKEIEKRLRDQEGILIDLAKEQNKKFDEVKNEVFIKLNTRIISFLKNAVKKGKIKYIKPEKKAGGKSLKETQKKIKAIELKLNLQKINESQLKQIKSQINELQNKLQITDANIGRSISAKFLDFKKDYIKEIRKTILQYEELLKAKPASMPRKEILELRNEYFSLSRKLNNKISNKFKELEDTYFLELEKIRKDIESLKLPKLIPSDVKNDILNLKRNLITLQKEMQFKPVQKQNLKPIESQINELQNKLQITDANIGRSISAKFLDFKKDYIKEIKKTISQYEELLKSKPELPKKESLELKKNYLALSRKLNNKILNKFKELEETYFSELEKIRKDIENLKAKPHVQPNEVLEFKEDINKNLNEKIKKIKEEIENLKTIKPPKPEIEKEILNLKQNLADLENKFSNKISNKFNEFKQIYLNELEKVQKSSEEVSKEAHENYLSSERISGEIQSKVSNIDLLRNEIEELKNELNKFKEESNIQLLKQKFNKISKEMDFLENEIKKVSDKHLAVLNLLENMAKKSKK